MKERTNTVLTFTSKVILFFSFFVSFIILNINIDAKTITKTELKNGQRKILRRTLHTKDFEFKLNNGGSVNRIYRVKPLKIYQSTHRGHYSMKVVSINQKNTPSPHCIISYATLNGPYKNHFDRIIEGLKSSGYKGDFLYRVGGWPNMEADGLDLSLVPYAFKISAFREAKRLGYKYVMWIDACLIPKLNPMHIIEDIKKHGYAYKADYNQPFLYALNNSDNLKKFDLTEKQAKKMTHIQSQVLGLDLSDSRVNNLLNDWYSLAKNKPELFHVYFCDQLSFTYLAYKHNLIKWMYPKTALVSENRENRSTTFLFSRT